MSWGGQPPQQFGGYNPQGAPPTGYNQNYGQPGGGQPGQYNPPPGPSQQALYGQSGGPRPAYGTPTSQGYNQPPQGQQPGGYGQQAQGGYGQQAPGQYGQQAPGQFGQQPPGQYGQQPPGGQYRPQGQYGQPPPGGQYGQPPAYGQPQQGGYRPPPPQQGGYGQPGYGGQPGGMAGYGGAPPAQAPPGVNPEVWGWFQAVDTDRSGKITASELQQALHNGNWSAFNAETCRLMIGMFDKDRSGTIDIHEFAALWKYIQDWKQCFDRFDTDRSGNIDTRELSTAFQTFGYNLSPQFCDLVIRVFDKRGARNINFDDFIQASVMLKTFTDKFRAKDAQQTGQVRISYEEFLDMALDIKV